MDQLFQLDGGTTQLTLPQFMDEMITQKLRCWRAAQEKIPDGRLAEQIMAMCWGGSDGNVLKEPGCLLPDHHKGGYVFVPYNEGEHLSPELVAGKERLEKALQDKANAVLARKMDKALEREVNEKCFWEFLDGDGAARVDFHGKINILAKHRLIQEGIDVSPASPAHPQFRFGLTDITQSGTVNMHWRSLPWSCTESDVVRVLTTFSRPNFSPESALRAQLADLATIEYPADAAEEARGLEKELRERAPAVGEPEWQYILCRAEEQKVPAEEREWAPLRRQPNDVKVVKRLSREQGKWPIITVPWQMRHYKLCQKIARLQNRQTGYLLKLEEHKALQRKAEGAGEAVGEKYFSQGPVSSLEVAWRTGQGMVGGDGGGGGSCDGGSGGIGVNGGGLGAPAAEVVA